MPTNIYQSQELTLNQLKWKNHYDKLCQRGQERASTRKDANIILGYSEYHHIIPRCMGGTDNKTNLVFLSAREHFIAHQFLIKIYPANIKLAFAVHRMIFGKNKEKIDSKEYNWLRTVISNATSKSQKGRTKLNCSGKLSLSQKMTGKTKETDPRLASVSETLTGRTKEEYKYLADISEKLKGRTKETHTGIASMAEKKMILNDEHHQLIVMLRLSGQTFKQIHKCFICNYKIEISYGAIRSAFYRTYSH